MYQKRYLNPLSLLTFVLSHSSPTPAPKGGDGVGELKISVQNCKKIIKESSPSDIDPDIDRLDLDLLDTKKICCDPLFLYEL